MNSGLVKIYSFLGKGPIRVLYLILSLVVAFAVLWDPKPFAAHSSSLAIWQGLLMIWAVCVGVIHGVGFSPRAIGWRIVFFYPLSLIVLICILVYIVNSVY